jgi:hypothetical protein
MQEAWGWIQTHDFGHSGYLSRDRKIAKNDKINLLPWVMLIPRFSGNEIIFRVEIKGVESDKPYWIGRIWTRTFLVITSHDNGGQAIVVLRFYGLKCRLNRCLR